MRDPHVDSLHYRLVPVDTVKFAKHAAPVEADRDAFKLRLAGETLDVEMRTHHAAEESARAAVEPHLRAWEIGHALRMGGEPEFRFEFVRAEIIDRDPPSPGASQRIEASALVHARAILSATTIVERGSLPAPPSTFVLDADVETVVGSVARVSRGPRASPGHGLLRPHDARAGRRP